jgi:hypothetical protein
MSAINPVAVLQATGVAAVDLFLKTYADFVALFDSEELAKAIQDELAFSGVSENTQKSVTIQNFFHDIERLTYDLLERGALRKIQRFGITPEAQVQITRLENSVRGIPRGATGGSRTPGQSAGETQEPVSKWASLTSAEFDRMSSSEVKRLRQTDPDFREAVERLAQEDAAKGPAPDSTGKVYLKRADGQFFQEWKYGQSVWTRSFDLRAYMTYEEGNRIITMLAGRGIQVQALEMGNNQIVDVAPKTIAPVQTTTTTKNWSFEPTGLTTVGQNQRKHRPGTFILKGDNGEFVAAIDDANSLVKTVKQAGNARAWTSREAAVAAAESFPLLVQLCRHDGTPA